MSFFGALLPKESSIDIESFVNEEEREDESSPNLNRDVNSNPLFADPYSANVGRILEQCNYSPKTHHTMVVIHILRIPAAFGQELSALHHTNTNRVWQLAEGAAAWIVDSGQLLESAWAPSSDIARMSTGWDPHIARRESTRRFCSSWIPCVPSISSRRPSNETAMQKIRSICRPRECPKVFWVALIENKTTSTTRFL